jgi:hypothetical protein
MKTHRSLRYMIVWTGRSPGRHRREPPQAAVRTQATRGIVVPVLVVASLGTAVGVSAVQAAGSHVSPSAHPAAASVSPRSDHPWIW